MNAALMDSALDTATVRTFRVPDVGMVRVEIGDGPTGFHGHTYPAHRVTIDGLVVKQGQDWGVPRGKCTDDVDAALSLLFWVAYDRGDDNLGVWVDERIELRAALGSPLHDGWRDAVRYVREGY